MAWIWPVTSILFATICIFVYLKQLWDVKILDAQLKRCKPVVYTIAQLFAKEMTLHENNPSVAAENALSQAEPSIDPGWEVDIIDTDGETVLSKSKNMPWTYHDSGVTPDRQNVIKRIITNMQFTQDTWVFHPQWIHGERLNAVTVAASSYQGYLAIITFYPNSNMAAHTAGA